MAGWWRWMCGNRETAQVAPWMCSYALRTFSQISNSAPYARVHVEAPHMPPHCRQFWVTVLQPPPTVLPRKGLHIYIGCAWRCLAWFWPAWLGVVLRGVLGVGRVGMALRLFGAVL